MTTGVGAIGAWSVLIGVPAALALWMRTSHMPTDGATDRLIVGAVALVCVAAVMIRSTGQAVIALPLAVAGSAAACVDAREGRLPDALTLTLLPATLTAVGVVGALGSSGGGTAAGTALVDALLAAALGLLAALVVKLASDAVVGWGDVKLAPTVAVVVGHGGSMFGFAAIVALGVAATALLVSRVRKRDADDRTKETVVPYGPALVLGALFATGPG